MPFRRLIQTAAAANHGNSGGPLFVKRNNTYHWIGINTMRIEKASNLGFTITATDAVTTSYTWYPGTPAGASRCGDLNGLHKLVGAGVSQSNHLRGEPIYRDFT